MNTEPYIPIYNIGPLKQGNTLKAKDFQLVKEVEGQADEPVDLTDVILQMQIRKAPGGVLIFELSTANSRILITDAAQGKFRIVEIEKFNLPAFVYFHDLKMTFPDGTVLTFFEGKLDIRTVITE